MLLAHIINSPVSFSSANETRFLSFRYLLPRLGVSALRGWVYRRKASTGLKRTSYSVQNRVSTLLQLRILGFGLLQDRDVRVGVFPEGEKVLVRSLRPGGVAVHGIRST